MERYVFKVLDNNLGCQYLKTQSGASASWKGVSDIERASKFDSISEALNALARNAYKADISLPWGLTITKVERSGWQEAGDMGDAI